VFNVLMGRYKVLTGEFADLMLGYYGDTLGEKNPEVVKLALEHAKKPAINSRPADLLKPEWEHLRTQTLAIEGCNGSDEDVLTFAMFPQVAPKFFKTRHQGPKNLGKEPGAPAKAATQQPAKDTHPAELASSPHTYVITLNGQEHKVSVAPAV
jgi:methylmalonyl-CoA carboxyltransferase 5S subunit